MNNIVKKRIKKQVKVNVKVTGEEKVILTHPDQTIGTIAEFLPIHEMRTSEKGRRYRVQVGEKLIRAYNLCYKKGKLVAKEVV